MIVYTGNKGAVDLINGWNIGGGTKHMDCRIMFLREMKENGTIRVQWIPSGSNPSDIFTKNVDKQTFMKHVKNICGEETILEQGRVSTDNFGIKLQAEWCSENMRLWDWTTVQDMSDANNNLLNCTSKGVSVKNTLKKVCQNKSQ